MIRLATWIFRRVDGFKLVKWGLACLALASLGSGILGSVEGLPEWPIWTVLLLGLVAGMGLSRWVPNPLHAGGLSLLAGFSVAFLATGRLAGPVMAWLVEGAKYLFRTLQGSGSFPPPSPAFSRVSQQIIVILGGLISRGSSWLRGITAGQVESDSLIIALLWSVLLWVLASWLGWYLQKGSYPLVGLLPSGIILGYTLYFSYHDPVPLLTFLGAFLMMLVVHHKISLEHRWFHEGVDFPSDTGIEMTLTGGGLTLLILTVAILVPNLSWPRSASGLLWWAERNPFLDASLTTALGLTRQGKPISLVESLSYGGLPRLHLLGTGPELQDQLVMAIEVQDIGRQIPVKPGQTLVPLYWRSMAYRIYDGRGWRADVLVPERYEAGERLPTKPLPFRRYYEQRVSFLEDLGSGLYVAGELISVDQPFEVQWREKAQLETSAGRRGPPEEADLFAAFQGAEEYRVQSRVLAASVDQLRLASGPIPKDIASRYLELPEVLPDRVVSLASDLTAGKVSSFDRAQAIEAYLRHFPYNLDVPPPPQNRDVVDYFLFDLQQGYCDYYATAMVVLARAAGLPARMVVGFAQGQFDPQSGRYWVSQANAHSWVEVYLPSFGWVEFEPTAGLPALERPLRISDLPTAEPGTSSGGESPDLPTLGKGTPLWATGLRIGLIVLAGSMGLAALLFFGLPAVRGWQMGRWEARKAYARIGQALYRVGHQLSVPIHPGDTLYEYSTKLAARLSVPIHSYWRGAGMAERAAWLLDCYARCLFDPALRVGHDHQPAVRVWVGLQRRLWLMKLFIWLQRG